MSNTSLENSKYDIVSVLYHLLQNSDTVDKYCRDANTADDQELESFFREVQDDTNRLASKAQELLKSRLQ